MSRKTYDLAHLSRQQAEELLFGVMNSPKKVQKRKRKSAAQKKADQERRRYAGWYECFRNVIGCNRSHKAPQYCCWR